MSQADDCKTFHGDVNNLDKENVANENEFKESLQKYVGPGSVESINDCNKPPQLSSYEVKSEEDQVVDSGGDEVIRAAAQSSELVKQRLPPKIRDVLYWKNPVVSGSLLCVLLLAQMSMMYYSLISLIAYSGLLIMALCIGLRLYAHYASNGSNWPTRILDADWVASKEQTEVYTKKLFTKFTQCALSLKDLILINNYLESLKFAVVLYFMTYIGANFNFLTLTIMSTLAIFALPKSYDSYKNEIDHCLYLSKKFIVNKMEMFNAKVKAMIAQKRKSL